MLEIIRYKGAKVAPIALGLIVNNLLRGIGIILLIPGLALLQNPEQAPSSSTWLGTLFSSLQINLVLSNLLIIIVGLIIITALVERYIAIKVNQYQVDMKQHVRQKLFDRIMHMPWQDFSQYNTAELMRLVDSEITHFSKSVNNLFKLFVNSLHALAYIIAATLIHWKITAFMLIVGSLLLLVSLWFNQKIIHHASRVNVNRASIYQTSLDILHNFKFAKVQGLEEKMQDDFGKITQKETEQNKQIFRTTANTNATSKILSGIALAAFIWSAMQFFNLQAAEVLVILFIAVRILNFTTLLQRNWQLMLTGIPSFHNVSNILHHKHGLGELLTPSELSLTQQIRFNEVSYQHKHQTEDTLSNASLSVPANKITVIVGRSGSGKTTLVDLMAGILSPESGEITIDDTVLDQSTRHSWSRNIAYLPQEIPMFSGTIRDNFKYSHIQIDDAAIWKALSQAQILKKISKLPGQLDTVLGEHGRRLSGGERQRIALARAISTKPELLILDEPTSAQDYINEQSIQHSLTQLKHQSTIVIIAHKRNIIRHADHLIIIDDGKILAEGELDTLRDHPILKHLI